MKKKLKKHFKFINLVWISGVALAAFTYFVAVAPQNRMKKQIAAELAEREKAYAAVAKVNDKQAQEALNRQMQSWKDEIRQYVITQEELAGLTFDISQCAKDAKIESFSIMPDDTNMKQKSTAKYVMEKQFKVQFRADFNKFAAFLNAVERYRPVILINEFTIENNEHNALASQVNMSLTVFVEKKQGS